MEAERELTLLLAMIGGYIAGAMVALFPRLYKVSHGLSLLAAVSGVLLSLVILVSGRTISFEVAGPLPVSTLALSIDALSAFFILVISVLAVAASIYAWGYLPMHRKLYSIPLVSTMFNLFILSMVLVVSAADAFWFLVVWETMALTSFLLVTAEQRSRQAGQVGFIYLVMTHTGTALIFLSFLILYQNAGNLSFAALTQAGLALSSPVKNMVFLLVLVGFGTKAGMVPLHIWLPKAHPAAPSHVSALMSAVMIKTAIYGLLRFIFTFLGGGMAWWGVVVLILGVVSALLGVIYALMEHDIKRLLAFSSVENIGIILMGIGATILLGAAGQPGIAGLGLAAALYHLVNHALFKGLLFMAAGAVVTGTHSRNMEQLGGLIRTMPWTALLFLVGSISIAALPPFNGFVSEWLIYQALVGAGSLEKGVLGLLSPVAGAALALTGALVVVCFVKAFGITFLAQPRSEAAHQAREVPCSMLFAMGLLGMLCLALGVYPGLVMGLLAGVLNGMGFYANPVFTWEINSLVLPTGVPALSPWIFTSLLLGGVGLSIVLAIWAGGREKRRVAETWACGIPHLQPVMQYTAASFVKPIKIIFQGVLRPTREVRIENEGWSYFPVRILYHGQISPVFEKCIYQPVLGAILAVANQIRCLQAGSIHLYLGYIMVTLVVLLALAV